MVSCEGERKIERDVVEGRCTKFYHRKEWEIIEAQPDRN